MSLESSLRTIFNEALDQTDSVGRQRFLDHACGADHALRKRVERLLRAHDAAGNFLSERDAGLAEPLEAAGQQIGRYKLLEQIGEGGCGVVYMAEQEHPVRRRVALKVIKLGMDTRSVIARFEAERQALAMMDHPNIAKVLDAGATETGRPYFVMELVRGVKITDYCDQNHLTTEQRLHLFIQVCKAVQHAHQKGIIHRDLKPGNILVTLHDGVPVPKVIDFGIAKATGQERLTDKTLFTSFQQFIGTPAYMSPEQAEMSGLDIDTRSDIYSLGVLLYELLVGQTPFGDRELLSAGLDEMRRIIREKEPRPPSTRLATMIEADLSTAARQRHTDPPKLIHVIKGDLDWIVMKCLEKDRTRRYETAIDPALDIERHLRNEPVLARAPNRLYRFQKLVRRNRIAFAATGAVVVALLAGTILSTRLYLREKAALKTAEENGLRAARHAEEARQNLYAADMILAQAALQGGNLGRAHQLLQKYLPAAGNQDLRDWEWRYAWEQCRSDQLFSLEGHSKIVASLALSPNGQYLASGSYDDTINIWDLEKQTLHRRLQHNSPVRSVVYSKDGRELIAGTRDEGVVIWNCESWQRTACLSNVTVRSLTVSPDGRTLGVMGMAYLTLWDLAGRKRLAEFKIDNQIPLAGVAFSPDSSLIVYSSGDGTIFLCNVRDATTVGTLRGHQFHVQSLSFSPDGSTLVSGGFDQTIRIWDVSSQRERKMIDGFSGWIGPAVFSPSPDRSLLAVAGADQRIKLFETVRWSHVATLKGNLDEVWSVIFSKDGQRLFGAGRDGTIRCWPVPQEVRLESVVRPDYVRTASWPAGGKRLYLQHTNRVYSLWSFNPLQEVARYPVLMQGFTASAISPDGKFWAAATNGTVRIFDHSKETLLEVSAPVGPLITRLMFSRDNKMLAGSAKDNVCRLWAVPTLREALRIPFDAPPVTFIEFSRSNRLLALATGDRVDIWDIVSSKKLGSVGMRRQTIVNLSISLDDKRVATAESDGKVHLWEIGTGTLISSFTGQLSMYRSVGFSRDDQRLAACGADGTVTLWDTKSFQEVASLKLEDNLIALDFLEDEDDSLAVLGQQKIHILRAPATSVTP